jgi:hydrogenase nickel incorporation protein HypA/HybF
MHELSIALSMIEQVEQQAAAQSGGVRSIQVKIGALSGVDVEALRFAWEIARAGTPLAEAQLEIEFVPLMVRCPSCGVTRIAEIFSIACPDCPDAEQEILTGQELELVALEVDA